MCIRDSCERVVELFTLREREIILFDVVRSYEELLEKLKRERISTFVDLPLSLIHI